MVGTQKTETKWHPFPSLFTFLSVSQVDSPNFTSAKAVDLLALIQRVYMTGLTNYALERTFDSIDSLLFDNS